MVILGWLLDGIQVHREAFICVLLLQLGESPINRRLKEAIIHDRRGLNIEPQTLNNVVFLGHAIGAGANVALIPLVLFDRRGEGVFILVNAFTFLGIEHR